MTMQAKIPSKQVLLLRMQVLLENSTSAIESLHDTGYVESIYDYQLG